MVNRKDRLQDPASGLAAWLFLWTLVTTVAFGVGCGSKPSVPPPAEQSTSRDPKVELQNAIQERNWSEAIAVAEPAMIAHPDDADVLTNVAIATAQTGDRQKAASLLVEAVEADDYSTAGGRIDNAVAALLDVGHLHDAIDLLQKVVDANPDQASYRRMLVGFLGEAQLVEQVVEHMKVLIEQRQFDLPLLLATTETSSRRYSEDSIELLLKRNPSDLRPRLGEAKRYLDKRDAARAEEVLREIVARHPDFAPAHAMLGIAMVSQGKWESLPDWYDSLPEGTSDFSGYWFAVGDWALATGDAEGAVRALTEATRRNPNESAYWALMAAALRQRHDQQPDSNRFDYNAVSGAVVNRQKDLLQLRDQFAEFKGDGQKSQSLAFEVAATLTELGRLWEAEAWLAIASTLPSDPTAKLAVLRQQVVQKLTADRDWQSQSEHPELAFDPSRFRLPKVLDGHRGVQPANGERLSIRDAKPIRMRDATSSLGLSFYGRVGDRVRGPRIPITQTLGCGGAMIDFDADGRQDLVFAAAGGRIREQDSDPGAIFRNVDSFVDVSSAAGFGDRGFSQGIVVGDYNDDGFADLLVLNLGPNRLFRNNGDGTLSDASELLGEQGKGQWSTSGAILDINDDGHNDIVIVNYCDSRDPLEKPCFDSSGNEINCYPLEYRAARDQILAGLGDGTFVDRSEQWIADAKLGRGLGIVAGRLDGSQQCFYIANDASPNTFYRWRAEENKLLDQALALGLAVDAQSFDQGSMGIASSDLDHDGDLDFYVTGFANEYNILYEQQSPGFWSDRTAAKGMVRDTLQTVGFGTEAVDLDNDGVDELLVTNGHVGIFKPPLPPYAQQFQLFRRQADGNYQSLDLQSWDRYFESSHVGRALFAGDVDNDGRCDAVVTHATEPVAILLNDSDRSNHRVVIRLVDRDRSRDAVGAVVEFELGDPANPTRRRLFQLAGDGYLCTNQQTLWAGMGSNSIARNCEVVWPDGTRQSVGDLTADASYLLIRDEPPFLLNRFAE